MVAYTNDLIRDLSNVPIKCRIEGNYSPLAYYSASKRRLNSGINAHISEQIVFNVG